MVVAIWSLVVYSVCRGGGGPLRRLLYNNVVLGQSIP